MSKEIFELQAEKNFYNAKCLLDAVEKRSPEMFKLFYSDVDEVLNKAWEREDFQEIKNVEETLKYALVVLVRNKIYL